MYNHTHPQAAMNKRSRTLASSESSQLSGVGGGEDARMQRQRRSDEIRAEVTERIQTHDPEHLLEELSARWELDNRAASVEDFTRLAMTNLGANPDADIDLASRGEFGLRALEETIERHEQEAIAVFNALRQKDPEGERPELLRRSVAVLEQIEYAKKAVLSAFQARLGVHGLHCSEYAQLAPDLDVLLGSWALRFRWFDMTKCTPLQRLLLHILDRATEKGYRKHNGFVYEPIVTPEGHRTHAWRRVCEIKDFVYSCTEKETNCEQWMNMTASGNNAKMAAEHLTNCIDYQFRFLRRNRSVFAFENGVYLADRDEFRRFGVDPPLSDDVVACNYFAAPMPPERVGTPAWRDLPTPSLQCIMDFQEWPPEVCDWMYILLGRLLYGVGARDGWQVIPFLLGSASSGKSTVALKVAKMFYEHGDVGVLSNNIERQFGLSAFYDKLLFVGPEIKGDFRVEQAEMQSIVSGESVQVAAKHKKAITVEWDTPGLMAGNEVPSFCDNAGSVQRRFVVFSFTRAVVNGDMKLGDKLAAELPVILLKCNRAYLEASEKWGARNVWTVLPSYFRDTRNQMAQAVNSIEAFLASSDVVLRADRFCPFKDFKDMWMAFSRGNGYSHHNKPVTVDMFTAPFEKYGLRLETGVREYRGGNRRKAQWVVGVDLETQEDADAAAALG